MNSDNVKLFENPFETARACAIYIVGMIETTETIHIALSGGSTPKLLFDYLTEHYARQKFWQKVHFYWGDERCVPAADQESNYRMARLHLLDHIAAAHANIHRIRGEDPPQQEVKRYATLLTEQLPQQNGLPVFDLIILGLGDDGHTASIFPGQMHLLKSKNICEVAQHPQSGQKRITLSGPAINNARKVLFLVTGEKKSEKVSEILNKSGQWKDYPASYISPRLAKVQWFMDKAASSRL